MTHDDGDDIADDRYRHITNQLPENPMPKRDEWWNSTGALLREHVAQLRFAATLDEVKGTALEETFSLLADSAQRILKKIEEDRS